MVKFCRARGGLEPVLGHISVQGDDGCHLDQLLWVDQEVRERIQHYGYRKDRHGEWAIVGLECGRRMKG